jgi:EAL domain-containing protein (putative c-di-GMP-specific phosphodiesterase class I)
LVAPPDAEDPLERLLLLAAEELEAPVTLELLPDGRPDAGDPAAEVVMSVPIPGGGGRCYGRLLVGAGGRGRPLPAVVHAVARLIGERIDRQVSARRAWDEQVSAVRRVLDRRQLRMRYQPIVDLASGEVVGVEALARFPGRATERPPERWFAEASAVGLGAELELAAIALALEDFAGMGEALYLSVNVSPDTATSTALRALLRDRPLDRLVFEITEHAEVSDYGRLEAALRPLRRDGLRIAVDDAGAGFAGLRHILQLDPEIIKLDRSLTRGIDRDPVLRALTYSIAAFASATEATVVAEGIEEAGELAALRYLDVPYGQGFHLCRPDVPGGIAARTNDVIDLGALNRSSAG